MSSFAQVPRSANILEAIRAALLALRKFDTKVAQLVLAEPARVLEATVAELADLASVSQPTVIRFCVAMGFWASRSSKSGWRKALRLGRLRRTR